MGAAAVPARGVTHTLSFTSQFTRLSARFTDRLHMRDQMHRKSIGRAGTAVMEHLRMGRASSMPPIQKEFYYTLEMPQELRSDTRTSAPGIRPAANSIIAMQRFMSAAGMEYWDVLSASPIKVTLTIGSDAEQDPNKGRMLLEWDGIDGLLEAGSCSIIEYPKLRDAEQKEAALLHEQQKHLVKMIQQLIIQHGEEVEDVRDISGAGLIHCLVIANNKDSLDLAMELFRLRPQLLMCTHKDGKGDYRGVFDGEGSLHILAVNKKEKEFCKLIELAHQTLGPRGLEKLLMQKCTGTFFELLDYGATPLSYAAACGLKLVFEKLLVDPPPGADPEDSKPPALLVDRELRHLVINGSSEEKPALQIRDTPRFGYYPIHAVVACGTPEMYDMLVEKCGALETHVDGCPVTGRERLTPLTLAAKLGRKDMFRHILARRRNVVWEWGPMAEYEIPLDEIDSSGSEGHVTVMELLVAPGSNAESQEMLLDDFMAGFLFKNLYKKKWKGAILGLFWVRLLLIFAYVILVSIIACPSFYLVDGVHAGNIQSDAAMHKPVVIVELVIASVLMLIEVIEFIFSMRDEAEESHEHQKECCHNHAEETHTPKKKKKSTLVLLREAGGRMKRHLGEADKRFWQGWDACYQRGGLWLIVSSSFTIAGCIALLIEEHARSKGWVRFCLSLGSFLAWVLLLHQGRIPFPDLNVLVTLVFEVLRHDVTNFLKIFAPMLLGFTTGLNSLVQPELLFHSSWSSWWLSLEKLLLLSFIQEPPMIAEDSPSPSAIVSLFGDFEVEHSDSVLPTVLFYFLFVAYLIVSVLLLINLLIAIMSNTFSVVEEASVTRPTPASSPSPVARHPMPHAPTTSPSPLLHTLS